MYNCFTAVCLSLLSGHWIVTQVGIGSSCQINQNQMEVENLQNKKLLIDNAVGLEEEPEDLSLY